MRLLTFLVAFAGLTLVACSRPTPPSSDFKTVVLLIQIRDAQRRHYSTYGSYANADAIVAFKPSLPNCVKRSRCYDHGIRIEADRDRYQIAAPAESGYARRSFFLDQGGLIRQEWDGPASAKSPVLR